MWKDWALKTSLTRPLFIAVPVPTTFFRAEIYRGRLFFLFRADRSLGAKQEGYFLGYF
jgi:hypothetical protein